MEQTSLEEALDVTVEKPEPAVESKDESPEVPEVTEASETEKPEAEKSEAEPKMVPHQALHEARLKAQKFEERFNTLSDQLGQLLPHLSKVVPKPEEPKQEPEIDFYKDPEGFIRHGLSEIDSRHNQQLQSLFLKSSEDIARSKHEDYDEALTVFEDMAKKNPLLRQQILQVENPGDWVYRVAKQRMLLGDAGDIETFEKNLREKVAKELAEKAGEEVEEVEEPAAPKIPKSLATARNVGGKRTGGKKWEGPTPLDAALAGVPGRQRK